MKLKLLGLFLIFNSFLHLKADVCLDVFAPNTYIKNRIGAEYNISVLSSKSLNASDLKSLLKEKKVSYRQRKVDGEDMILLTGKDDTQLSRLVRHAEKYDTKVYIDPNIESGFLGYFSYTSDFERIIVLSPNEIFTRFHEGYQTLIHELRHARYDFLRELQVSSVFHGEMNIISKSNKTFMLPHQKHQNYTTFQSFEELPLFTKDLHAELLKIKKLGKLNQKHKKELEYLVDQTKEMYERVNYHVKYIREKPTISALNDEDIVTLTLTRGDFNINFYSFDERLLNKIEIRMTPKNEKLVKEIVDEHISELISLNQKMLVHLNSFEQSLNYFITTGAKTNFNQSLNELIKESSQGLKMLKNVL